VHAAEIADLKKLSFAEIVHKCIADKGLLREAVIVISKLERIEADTDWEESSEASGLAAALIADAKPTTLRTLTTRMFPELGDTVRRNVATLERLTLVGRDTWPSWEMKLPALTDFMLLGTTQTIYSPLDYATVAALKQLAPNLQSFHFTSALFELTLWEAKDDDDDEPQVHVPYWTTKVNVNRDLWSFKRMREIQGSALIPVSFFQKDRKRTVAASEIAAFLYGFEFLTDVTIHIGVVHSTDDAADRVPVHEMKEKLRYFTEEIYERWLYHAKHAKVTRRRPICRVSLLLRANIDGATRRSFRLV